MPVDNDDATVRHDALPPTTQSSSFFHRLAGTMLWSLLLKVVTFTLTTLFTRRVSPTVRGVAFYLDLYGDTVGFLAKEAVRSTVLRSGLHSTDLHLPASRKRCLSDMIHLFNAAAFSLPIAMALIGCCEGAYYLSGGWLSVVPSLLALQPAPASWGMGIALFATGLGMQALSEPKLCVSQTLMAYRTKVSAESIALGCRLVVFLSAAIFAPQLLEQQPLLVGCVAHCVYGVVHWCVFEWSWWAARRQGGAPASTANALVSVMAALKAEGCSTSCYELLSRPAMAHQARQHVSVWSQFFSESIVRVVLTEGEKFALAAFGSLADQGVYDAVNNLGSIVVRLVFRLWEESCFARWSTMMSGNHAPSQRHAAWTASYALLEAMLALAVQVSMPFLLFGPPLAGSLLHALYSGQWGSSVSAAVLGRLCVALPLMAINGLLEAFQRATASATGLAHTKAVMFLTSGVYVCACFALMRLSERGVVGLMEALIVSVAVRCFLSGLLIASEHARLLPSGKEGAVARAVHPLLVFRWLPAGFWSGCLGIGAAAWYIGSSSMAHGRGNVSPLELVQLAVLMVVYVGVAMLFDGQHRLLTTGSRRLLQRRGGSTATKEA